VDQYRRALSFGWIVCTLAVAFFALYGLWQLGQNEEELIRNAELGTEEQRRQLVETVRSSLLMSLFGSPLFGLINVMFSSVLYHLGIKLASDSNQGFCATFRATAYGFAPLLLVAVPFVGYLIGGMWSLILQVIALSQVHETSPARAALAVLLPVTAMLLLLYTVVP